MLPVALFIIKLQVEISERRFIMRGWLDRIQFVFAVLGVSWLGMMATHELGHVIAAKLTGGNVVRVVLHPGTISRTDVSPNPSPLVVAWAGPILGCLIPLLLAFAVRDRKVRGRSGFQYGDSAAKDTMVSGGIGNSKGAGADFEMGCHVDSAMAKEQIRDEESRRRELASRCQEIARFFAGFCCIANGAYLGVGAFDRVGDTDEILKAGTSPWILVVLGLIAFFGGLVIWHRLGSPFGLFQSDHHPDRGLVRGLLATLLLIIIVECIFSPI